MRLALVVVISMIAGVMVGLWLWARQSPYRISAEEARKQLAAGQIDLILDVRTAAERATLGFYPNSVHVAGADLAAVMPAQFPDRSIRILAYCNTGQRARAATEKLVAMGYTNVRYISGSHLSILS